MEFPRKTLDVTQYQQKVRSLLCDSECAVFIDTNVISQLYRLNDAARQDFYQWMDQCGDRFHVPVWVIHEYSTKVYSNKTKEYLSELDKIKTQAKEFSNISDFVKGYVGDSLLQGSEYQGKTDQLKKDVDTINTLLGKISCTINMNLEGQQRKVHDEIEKKMSPRSLETNIYSLIPNLDEVYRQRYENHIPPGYKDAAKEDNKIGDLVIWKEILGFCKCNNIKKAVLLSRDSKQDIVYSPEKQTIENGRSAGAPERVKIAKESLVYEFKTETGGTDFYIIDFKTFVRIFSSEYRELAKSFQIATAEEEKDKENLSNEYDPLEALFNSMLHDEEEKTREHSIVVDQGEDEGTPLYSGTAIRDGQYDTTKTTGCMDSYIEQLKSYNWYIQNPAINKIMRLKIVDAPNTDVNRSSVFVLGRNILQSAEGSSGSAISFLENFSSYLKDWEQEFKKALIDGILFEIFFDSNGKVRPLGFKATYFDEIIKNITKMHLKDPFVFINDKLSKVNTRFVPRVGTDTVYKFVFKTDTSGNTLSLACNNCDISDTFKKELGGLFAYPSQLKAALKMYYAILEDKIEIEGISPAVNYIGYIFKPLELPF